MRSVLFRPTACFRKNLQTPRDLFLADFARRRSSRRARIAVGALFRSFPPLIPLFALHRSIPLFRSPCPARLESPRQFRVHAPLYLCGVDDLQEIVEFFVMVLHQILANHAQLQVLTQAPGQLGIKPRVRRHKLRGQCSYKIGIRIPREFRRQLNVGTQLRLMPRIRSLCVCHANRILARWFQM